MRKHGFLFAITTAVLAFSMCGCGSVDGDTLPAASGESTETSSDAPFLTVVPSPGSEIPEFPSKCKIYKQRAVCVE